MAEIIKKFVAKKGLDVQGDATVSDNLSVAGYITVPTQAQTDNSTKVANTEYVRTAINNLVDASPGALDTLNELAAALGDDPNFATTMTNNLALKAPLASPALTGTPTAPTAVRGTNTTQIATTAFVADGLSLKANLASPALTGTPTAPTAAADTNTTQLATTAFVIGQAASVAPLMDGTAAVGTSKRYARQDHVHPSDTTKANLSGATFTGPVDMSSSFSVSKLTGTESAIDIKSGTKYGRNFYRDSDDNYGIYLWDGTAGQTRIRIAGLAGKIVLAESGLGNVIIGTSTDNNTDKLQVNGSISATTFKGSAELTGTPTAPTAVAGTNTTQIATTAFVTAADNLKANVNNPAFTGDASFAGAVASSDLRHIIIPDGGRYATTTNVVTGAFKIALPVLYTSNMLSFEVTVFEYASGKSFKLHISGYNFASNSTWTNPTIYVTGGVECKIPNVRFGNDGSKACIWIGELTDTWDYPQLFISNVTVGFQPPPADWLGAWSVAPVTTFDTVKIGPYIPSKFAPITDPVFTGTPRVPTATPNSNSTQIANTTYVDTALGFKAPLASPALTGTPTAPTAAVGTNTTQIATTAFVTTAVNNVLDAAPGALDTLNELAAALGDDPNFATTMTNNLALKAPLASPAFTGTPTAPTPAVDTNNIQVATTEYVVGQGYLKSSTASSTYAPKVSPALTGTPTAPTAASTTESTQIATTAFVHAAMDTILTKNITGSVTLTAAEAANRTIILTGALTANATVIFPTGVGRWIIDNRTTGAYWINFKMSTGTGVIVAQGYRTEIISDGTNVVLAQTDFTDAYLAGTPTAPTPPANNNSTRIATTAYVDAADNLKANVNNPAFTGDASFAGAIATSDRRVYLHPEGGKLYGTASTVTGAFKIKLPVFYTSNMLSFEVTIYEYLSGKAMKLFISGYNYNSTPSTWYQPTTFVMGEPAGDIPTIRFGDDGVNCCIWIGEINDTWSYPQIFVNNISLGHGAPSAAWNDPWSITAVTAFDTVKVTVTPTKFAGLASPAFTGTPTAPTAALGTSTTQLATTQFVNDSISAYPIVKSNSTNSADPFGLVSADVSLTLTTDWQDTGIQGNQLSTGSYMIQMYADDNTVSGEHWMESYTGMMSWYSGTTNSSIADEIPLHRAGHAPGGASIFLRTVRTPTGGVGLKLQIAGSKNTSGASTYSFKFRRII